MSEKTVHVYRVTHVAEHLVEDDGIYDDDVDMLRDVLGAARQGRLEFEPTDADFVALNFDEKGGTKIHVLKIDGIVAPEKSPRLPTPEPPPALPRKLDDVPSPRPVRRPTRGRRRST